MRSNAFLPPVSAALLATVLFLAACSTASVRDDARPLANRDWRLVELNGRPAVTAGNANDPFLRFAVDSSRVTGNTGCNLLTGPFTLTGESLRFGALISTKRACVEQERNQQEGDFSAALSATMRYAVSGDTLTLFGASGPVARLVARAAP
jgi:heat shock protein HslJ